MTRIKIIRSAHGLEPLRSAWQCLYRGGGYSMFQSPGWNLLAARMFSGVAVPMVIHAESGNGAAIIPACVTAAGISFLGEALFDYRDVLACGDDEVLRRAWQQVAAEQRPLSLTALRGERAQAWQWSGFAPTPFCNAPAVRHADVTADDFVSRHTRSARLMRRLTRAGVELRTHDGANAALVRNIYELKAVQLGQLPHNLFAERSRIDFMVAAAALDAGCEIFTLETAGALVAALVSFRDDLVRRCYTIYYDRAWAPYSPGVALLYEVTRGSLAGGLDCDYMTGEQPHKMRFATSLAPLFRIEAEPSDLTRISHFKSSFEGEHVTVSLAA
ncbi:MAG: GNAT family N-acetyltransferase [Terriglobales bacterium]